MRYYKLEVGALTQETPTKSSIISDNTVLPLNIAFDLKIYNTTDVETVGSIKIHNLPQATYKDLSTKIRAGGTTVKLTAGWTSSPLASHHSLSNGNYAKGVLINAEASNIAADFSTIEPYIIIWFKAKNYQYVNKQGQLDAYQVQINTGDSIASKIKALLVDKFGVSSVEINITDTYTGKQTLCIGGNSVSEVAEKIRKEFGLNIIYYASTNKVVVKRPTEEDETTASQYAISYGDLLKQPEIIGPDKIAVTMRLCPSLYIGQKVVLSGTLPSGVSALDSGSDYADTSLTQASLIFNTGTYIINAINHTGEFYNPDAEAWSTLLELTRESSIGNDDPEEVKTAQATTL